MRTKLLPGQIVVTGGAGGGLRRSFGASKMTSPHAVCLIVAERTTPMGLQWLFVVTEGTMGWLHSANVRHVDDRPQAVALRET